MSRSRLSIPWWGLGRRCGAKPRRPHHRPRSSSRGRCRVSSSRSQTQAQTRAQANRRPALANKPREARRSGSRGLNRESGLPLPHDTRKSHAPTLETRSDPGGVLSAVKLPAGDPTRGAVMAIRVRAGGGMATRRAGGGVRSESRSPTVEPDSRGPGCWRLLDCKSVTATCDVNARQGRSGQVPGTQPLPTSSLGWSGRTAQTEEITRKERSAGGFLVSRP